MAEPGRLLGRGRAADVYDVGAGRVLRRYRTDHDSTVEAAIQQHLHAHGFPVPAVHDVDGRDMVMDRVDGPVALDAIARRPWTAARHGRLLADLHRRLDAVPPLEGGRVVHGDLHPGNVICSPDGPVVIDWSNGGAGDRDADVATTWVLVASGVPDEGPAVRLLAAVLRRRLLAGFLGGIDVPGARARLVEACERRLQDPNVRAAEVTLVRALRDRERR